MIWLKFAGIQLVMLVAALLGLFVLIPFCLARAWEDSRRADKIPIDRWTWRPLNWVYSNPEDGVSGRYALIWNGGALVHYMPSVWGPWRAYCWSALRNSADNLKYVFAIPGAPLKRFTLGRVTVKLGWQMENGFNVPVLSWSKTQ